MKICDNVPTELAGLLRAEPEPVQRVLRRARAQGAQLLRSGQEGHREGIQVAKFFIFPVNCCHGAHYQLYGTNGFSKNNLFH